MAATDRVRLEQMKAAQQSALGQMQEADWGKLQSQMLQAGLAQCVGQEMTDYLTGVERTRADNEKLRARVAELEAQNAAMLRDLNGRAAAAGMGLAGPADYARLADYTKQVEAKAVMLQNRVLELERENDAAECCKAKERAQEGERRKREECLKLEEALGTCRGMLATAHMVMAEDRIDLDRLRRELGRK